MFAEVIGGLLSGSLAFLTDAGHMLTDAASIALALIAMQFATRRATTERTYSFHRLEILAALINALSLWLIAAWVAMEAFHRFQEVLEVEGVTLIHDIHVWTIAPDYEALTAHVLIDPDYQGDLDTLRHRLREIASRDFSINHITLQLEKSRKGETTYERRSQNSRRSRRSYPWPRLRSYRDSARGAHRLFARGAHAPPAWRSP